jgi:hypothetical protein
VVQPVGFDRTPPAVTTPLVAAGSAVRAAATALAERAHGDIPSSIVLDATEQARTNVREVLERTSHANGWGLDRGDVVEIALALRAIADRIDDVAIALDHVERRADWVELCGVVRDLTRAISTALAGLDGPTDQCYSHLASVEALRHEGCSLLREARGSLLGDGADSIRPLAAHDLIVRLERAMASCRAAAAALRRTILKHR